MIFPLCAAVALSIWVMGNLEGGKESISGFCTLFDKKKGYYSNIPSRCKKLFDKARTYPNGAKLVIVQK